MIGQSTKLLRPGDRVSCRSRHFDPPGQPGAFSTGQPERFYGVVTGGCASRFFQVHYDTDRAPLRTKWNIVRLEKLGLMWDEPPPLRVRPDESANQFKKRGENDLARRRREAIASAKLQRRPAPSTRRPAALPPAPPRATLPPGVLDPFAVLASPAGVNWGRYTTDPGVAVRLFHRNSGLLAESEASFDALAAPAQATLEKCVANFASETSAEAKRSGCAGCGMMCKEAGLKKLQIGEATRHLARDDEEFTGVYNDLSELGKTAHHVKEIDGALYHVAPKLLKETADANGTTAFSGGFCAVCVPRPEKGARNKRARFVDRDYGVHFSTHYPSKPRLSLLEEMALARVLPFVVTVKLRSTNQMAATWAMRKHAFCLPHNGQDDFERQLLKQQCPPAGSGAPNGALARDFLNPHTPVALTYTFIGTGWAYRELRKKENLIHGLTINAEVGAEYINYLAEAGHPDFKRFQNLIPGVGAFAPQLQAALESIRTEILDAASVEDGQLIQTVESHMQAEGDGASVVAPEAMAPSDDRVLLDLVARETPLTKEQKIAITAVVRNELMNEYLENRELYQSAFPGLFPLGVPKEQRGPFPLRAWRPMLLGYQPDFERSDNFVGYTGDAVMRRDRSLSASLAFSSKRKFPAFEALVSADDFNSKLQDAVANPDGSAAKGMLKTMKSVFSMANKHVKWSRGERKAEVEKIDAVTRRFGPPTMMMTISPNATDEALVVSLAARGDDGEWDPQTTWNDKAKHLIERRKLTEGAPASCAAFYDEFIKAVLKCLVGNDPDASPPGAPAREKPITLIGRDRERVAEVPEGIFGRCRAAHGVTEAQGRGHLHAHILLWTERGPLYMARFFHDDDKQAALFAHIDGLVTSQLARGARLTSAHQCLKDQPPPAPENGSAAAQPGPVGSDLAPSLPGRPGGEPDVDMVDGDAGADAARGGEPAPAPGAGHVEPGERPIWNPESEFPERPRTLAEAESRAPLSGARFLGHRCCKRCRKPPKGHIMCAMGFSRPPQLDHTTVVECVLEDGAEFEPRRKKPKLQDRALVHLDVISSPPSPEVPVGEPVAPLDERCLMLRLHRPYLEDCFTSETNAILQGCAAHMNTNVSYVTGGQEANNMTFYMSKYASKMPNEVEEFMPLIMKARRGARRESLMPAMLKLTENARAFPSSADDKETSKRVSQFFLTKVLNKTSGLEETSGHQHAGKLCGQDSSFTSEKFVNCDVETLIRRAAEGGPRGGGRADARAPVASDSDSNNDAVGSDSDGEEASSDNGAPDNGAAAEPAAASTDFQRSGSVSMEYKDNAFLLLPRMDDFLYRDPVFYMCNYYEFMSMTLRKDKPEEDDGNGGVNYVVRGKDIDRAWEFQSGHKGAKTHYLVIRDRFCTPVFRNTVPPPLSHWKSGGAKQKAFIKFYAFTVIPYWLPSLPPPAAMWPGGRVGGLLSADQYLAPGAFSKLMKEWQTPASPQLFRERYALYQNMVHVQHTPHSSKVISAKGRFEFVKPWRDMAEKDRPGPFGEVAGDSSAASPTEDDVMDRMLELTSLGESLQTKNYKRLREGHRRHIHAAFQDIYPPLAGRCARDGDSDGEGEDAGEEGSAAAVAERVSASPFLQSAVENRCEWGEWDGGEPAHPPAPPQDASAPEDASSGAQASTWDLHSLRGYMDGTSILMCSSGSSWRIELPADALQNDPKVPANYPKRPSKLYLHKGFSGAAIRAGIDVRAPQTAGGLLPLLQAALAALGAGLQGCLGELGEGRGAARVISLALANKLPSLEDPASPSAAAELEKLRVAARSCHMFIRFLELTAPPATAVVFAEGDRVLRSDLNEDQKRFYDRVITELKYKLHLLCGRAGTGKTYVIAAIQHRLELMGIRCAAVAFMWSAVYQMKVTCEKSSIHRLLGLSVDDFTPERVAKMRPSTKKLDAFRERVKGLGALFVDEISTTAPELLVGLDKMLRMVLNPGLPFGGLIVILLGDFAQLPPVKAASLAQLAVTWSRRNHANENRAQRDEHLVEDEAAGLFISFRKFDLTESERCKDDPPWSNFTAGFDPARADPPISATDLEQLKAMRLSPSVIEGAPELQFATVAAQTNFETKILNDLQAFRFAKSLDEPIFRTVSGIQCAGGRSDEAAEGITLGGGGGGG